MIAIEESEGERSIVTPDLRLRFTWLGDRWTHAIDVGPGPWKVAAESVEWSSPEATPPEYGPTFQTVHFQEVENGVLALALGQAGPHHFSASFRVGRFVWEDQCLDPRFPQKRSMSFVEVDVADRCRTPSGLLEARYEVGAREYLLHLDVSSVDPPLTTERDVIVWEIGVEDHYDVCLAGVKGPLLPTSYVSFLESPGGQLPPWIVRANPAERSAGATNRLVYVWWHHRARMVDEKTGLPRNA